MAGINENYIWPLFGIAIFSVLIAFYLDDRRQMLTETTENTQVTETSETKSTSSAVKKTPTKKAASYDANKNAKSSGSSAITNLEFTGTIEEYLAKYGDDKKPDSSTDKSTAEYGKSESSVQNNVADSSNGSTSRSMEDYLKETSQVAKEKSQLHDKKLRATAEQHSAFTGNIDEYLASFSDQAKKKSMASANSTSAKTNTSKQSYSGSIEGYLSKYGNGPQTTPVSKGKNKSLPNHKPFGEHSGFHGSYEEYARIYN